MRMTNSLDPIQADNLPSLIWVHTDLCFCLEAAAFHHTCDSTVSIILHTMSPVHLPTDII